MSFDTSTVPTLELRDHGVIPQLGFGVFQIPAEDTHEAVLHALQTGYRHLDTAKVYGNEAEVGQAIHAAGLDRSEVFVTTKCWNGDQGYEQAKQALRASLDRLEFTYVDLYLIHWPLPASDKYVETWKALIEMQQEGYARSIGVSNFQPDHLHRLVDETGVTPAVNQIELHPFFQQTGLRQEHEDLGIITEAWAPLAQGGVLDDPVLNRIGEEHDRTAGQIALRWHLQLGNVIFPKSVTPERIEENFRIFDFHLSEAEMDEIAALDAGGRIGPDPDTFSVT